MGFGGSVSHMISSLKMNRIHFQRRKAKKQKLMDAYLEVKPQKNHNLNKKVVSDAELRLIKRHIQTKASLRKAKKQKFSMVLVALLLLLAAVVTSFLF